ncbi:MAG TPA: CPBP family glutamic-type intramembrane protease, partial [Solirubrobacteraceae bacterium]|nr:CPBP family glutamic-type intramembrane protease [Solirubrobacteraceae bacterium]
MKPFEGVPGWPPLAGVVALAVAYVASFVVVVVVALVAEAAGYEPADRPPGAVLLVAVLFALTSVGACLFVARQTAPLAPGQFGLRRVPPGEAALLVAAAALVLAAVVTVWAWATVERLAFPVPQELDRGDVDADAGLAASALARAVVAPVAGQVVLLGFVLPALSRWRGVVPAAILCTLLLAPLAGVVGDGGRLAVPALVLAALLVALRLRSGSLVPGIALACG